MNASPISIPHRRTFRLCLLGGLGLAMAGCAAPHKPPASSEAGPLHVAEQIDRIDSRTTHGIMLDVAVLSLELNRSGSADFNLTAALRKGGISIAGPAGADAPDAFSGTSLITNGTVGSQKFIKAVIKALSNHGRVSEITRQQIETHDLQPVPFSDSSHQGYEKPLTLVSELTSVFLPHILPDGRILLQSSIALTRLEPPQGPSNTSNITTSSTMREAVLTSGQTMLMTNLQEMRAHIEDKRTNTITDMFIRSGITGNQKPSIMIVLVTPRIEASPPRATKP